MSNTNSVTHTHLSTKFMAEHATVPRSFLDRYAKMVPSCQEVDGEIYISPTDSAVVLMYVMKDMSTQISALLDEVDTLTGEVAV